MTTRFTSNPVVPSVLMTNHSSSSWVPLIDESRLTQAIKKLSSEEKAEILLALLKEYLSEESQKQIEALLLLNKDYDKKCLAKQMLITLMKEFNNV